MGRLSLTAEGLRRARLLAHRAAWLPLPRSDSRWMNGTRIKTYGVLHHCDNKACVAPAHLFLGTQRDNALDAVRKQGIGATVGSAARPCSWRKLRC